MLYAKIKIVIFLTLHKSQNCIHKLKLFVYFTGTVCDLQVGFFRLYTVPQKEEILASIMSKKITKDVVFPALKSRNISQFLIRNANKNLSVFKFTEKPLLR